MSQPGALDRIQVARPRGREAAKGSRGGASSGEGPWPRVLYLGGELPGRSETFVYREVVGLRARGLEVVVASVREPERDLGEAELEEMADEAVMVYRGVLPALGSIGRELCGHPVATLGTLARSLADALFGAGVPRGKRLKVLWQGLAGIALAARVRHREVDHVHAHMAHVTTTIAMYAARQLGVPFSFTGHANDLFRERTLLPAKLRRSEFAACISMWHREFYRGFEELGDERLPIVRCAVDTAAFEPRGAGSPTRLLTLGRLVPKKGIAELIAAVGQLWGRGIMVRLAIAGEGPQQEELERLAGELGIREHVEFLGVVDNNRVPGLMEQARLFVLPCRVDESGDMDGIPVALMEAMAAGLCVVAGDLPAIRELIEDGVSGRLVPPGDVEGLAEVLAELIADGDRREALAVAGRARVREEFSLEVNLDRLIAALCRSHGFEASAPASGEQR